MPTFNGVKVEVYAPGDENDGLGRDIDGVIEALRADDLVEVPLASSEKGHVERCQVIDGCLSIGAWTGEGNGAGWYVSIEIPLLPTKNLQSFLDDLSGTLSNFSERFRVKDLRTKEVDSSGRVSVGKSRAGETVRVAILDDT